MIYLGFALGVMVGVLISLDWKARKLKEQVQELKRAVYEKTGSAEFYEPETPKEKFDNAKDIADLLK